MSNVAKLTAGDLGDDLRLVAFRGSEQLCRPYRFKIHFQASGPTVLDLAAGVGSRATLKIQRDENAPFQFHGILSSVQLHVQTAEWGLYQATLVPALWRLGQDRHSNAFTKITVPDLIEKVLADSLLTTDDYELRLDASYPEEELIVQYKESNLAFLHRWMEHVGLYYFFDHSGDREKLIITDHRSYHAKLFDKTIRYQPLASGDQSAGEAFDTFAAMHHATVERVRLSDYDYGNPALDVSSDSDVSDRGVGEVCVYGGRFFDPAGAARFATLRAEELRAREVVHLAAGTALHVSPGYHIELAQHPSDGFNIPYLITEAIHTCNQLGEGHDSGMKRWIDVTQEEVYRVEARAIDAQKQYRAPIKTPAPRVWGYENGVVDGEADSQYAQIDDTGRYKVKFHFDESDLKDGKASTYVRMMQPHGGGTEGFHFPLRKGTEVIFTFLGGDPDRPVIAGVVPNATTPSPVTEANHTKNILRTGSGSHLTIDDAQGKEYIHLHSPKLTELFMGGPTGEYCSEHTNKEFGKPPEEKASSSATEAVSCTYYLYTDGNSGTLVDKQYWLTVGEDINIYGGAKLREYYGAEHFLNIDGFSHQWFNDHRETKIVSYDDTTIDDYMTTTVKNDLTFTVTSGKTKIDTAQTTEIKSGDKIHIHNSGGDVKIESEAAKIDMDAATGVDIHSPAAITIESTGADVSIKSANKWSSYALGDWFKFTAAAGIGITLAATSETKIGIFNENLIGGKIETAVSLNMKAALSAALEFKFGFYLNVVGGIEVGMKSVKAETLGGKIDSLPFGLRQVAARMDASGFKVVA